MSTAPVKAQTAENSSGAGLFTVIVIPLVIAVCYLIYFFVMGNGANFEDGKHDNHPLQGNILGIVYKGGIIVPILMSCFVIVIVFTIERFLTIGKAKGKGSIRDFVRKIKFSLESNDVNGALKACDEQRGSVANVVKASVTKYKEMEADTTLEVDQKVLAIRKEVEESTSLELPMLEKNLVILATLASVATLIGLLGTVIGMIGAFFALGQAGGAVDASALSNGISEALINTALGIGTSAVAIIMYNFFTTKIDSITYAIDEAGFSIAETFAAKHK